MSTPPATPSNALDWRTVLITAAQHFAPWLAVVIVVTLAQEPGVVCITPLAWLLALRLGPACVARSASSGSGRRLIEAGLAGGLLGFLQGFLFWVILTQGNVIKPDERLNAVALGIVMVGLGVIVSGGLSLFMGYLTERRGERQT